MNKKNGIFRFISFMLAMVLTISSINVTAFVETAYAKDSAGQETGTFAGEDGFSKADTSEGQSYVSEQGGENEEIYGATTCVVTISSNGGNELTGDNKSFTVKVGESYSSQRVNKDLPLPSREGYLFSGFYTSPTDGVGDLITADTIVTVEGDHTIYAQWTKIADINYKDKTYVEGTCGPAAKWRIDNDGTFSIDGEGETTNYTYSGSGEAPWTVYKDRVIRSVVVKSSSITSIGSNFFIGCKSLQGEIDIKKVKKIGDDAFRACDKITKITSNYDVESIGDGAFLGCTKLESIITGSNFNSIGEGAFKYCENLKTIKFGNNLKTISSEAFFGCSKLTNITIPDSVTNINSKAFKGCGNLVKIRIPEYVEKIDEHAFDSSTSGYMINTTITAVPKSATEKSAGERFVNKKADESYLSKYYIEAKVEPVVSSDGELPVFKFEGAPLNVVKDLFNISNKNMYDDISYRLVGASAKNNEMDRDGCVRYIDDDCTLEVQIIINSKGHYLGTVDTYGSSKTITNKVKVVLPPPFKVYYNPNGGALTGSSSTTVKPFHRITKTPSKPVYKFSAYNNSYENTFSGWYTSPTDENSKWDFKANTVSGNMTLYAHWITDPAYLAEKQAREEREKEEEQGVTFGELTIVGLSKKTKVEYTGKPITFPDMKVYCGDTLLVKGKDYNVKYENNVNVSKEALIKIIGKGNYTDTTEIKFEITAIDIAKKQDEGLLIVDDYIYYNYTGNRIEGKPVVKLERNGKTLTLKQGRDFTYEYTDGDFTGFIEPNDSGDPYEIKVVGCGNYKNYVKVRQIITKATLITKGNFKSIYDSEGNPGVKISFKFFDDHGRAYYRDLVKDEEFTVEDDPENCVLTVKGIGKYSGMKKINYGTPIKKAKIKITTPAVSLFYTGEAVTPAISISYNGTALKGSLRSKMVDGEKYDYVYEYVDNVRAGKASIVIKGRGKFRGTVTKTFRILPFDLMKNQRANTREIKVLDISDQTMLKGGVKPKVYVTDITYKRSLSGTISSNTVELIEGKDYKLSYVNNKKKGSFSLGEKAPTVKITGIGNYKGVFRQKFTIVQSDLSKFDGSQITISDIIYKEKANICKPKITVRDSDNKNLSAGKDYQPVTLYRYVEACEITQSGVKGKIKRAAGDAVNAKDIIPANTKIEAVIKATSGGNYKGEVTKTFRIIEEANDISKASATVNNPQTFTGKPITLKITDLTVVMPDGTILDTSSAKSAEFEILGYKNNINTGKATVIIRGKEGRNKIGYGGTKAVTFTILPKSIQQ